MSVTQLCASYTDSKRGERETTVLKQAGWLVMTKASTLLLLLLLLPLLRDTLEFSKLVPKVLFFFLGNQPAELILDTIGLFAHVHGILGSFLHMTTQ